MTTAEKLRDGLTIILDESPNSDVMQNSSGISIYYDKNLSKKSVAKLKKLGFDGDHGSSFFELPE